MEILKQILTSDLGSSFNNTAFLIFRVLLGIQLFRVHGLKKFRLENGQKEIIPNPLGLPDKMNALVASFADLVVPFNHFRIRNKIGGFANYRCNSHRIFRCP